jgi:hypothetical protein
MKRLSFFFVAVFMLLCINTFGQDVYTGKIFLDKNPCPTPPDCPTCIILWLKTTSFDYALTVNSQWICDESVIFDGIEYRIDDEVEITGTVKVMQGMEEYRELEIEAIKKVEPMIETVIGKIFLDGNPCPPPDPDFPCLPCVVLWLETTSLDYVLTINSHWICDDKIIFDGVEYQWNDEVEITGTVTVWTEVYTEVVYELEIETIKKIETSIESLSFDNNKIYYNAVNQSIIIDATLQNKSLTLELYDMPGKAILRKTDVGNTISIANLPNGIYLYRLLENNRAIYSGKIVKQ